MIIDLMLDRKDGTNYAPKQFYCDVMNYGEIGNKISRAMDSGEELDIKTALSDYILENGYSLDITDYIFSVNWLV